MSFGLFESALGSDVEVKMAKQASVNKMAAAVYDVREKLGSFLFGAADVGEFRDRVAMVKNDQSVYKIIEAAGLHPSTGVVRRIVGKNGELEREFREKDHRHHGRRSRSAADYEKNSGPERPLQDNKITYSPKQDQPTFEPEGDFKGYLNSVQNTPTDDQIDSHAFSGPVKGTGSQEHTGDPSDDDFVANTNRDFGKAARRRQALGLFPDNDSYFDHVHDENARERALDKKREQVKHQEDTDPIGPASDLLEYPDASDGDAVDDFARGWNRDHAYRGANRRQAAPGETAPVRPDVPITNVAVPGRVTQNVQSGFDEQPDERIGSLRMAVDLYTDWCNINNVNPIRISSLETYGGDLSDSQYMRLAAVIQEWEFEHLPKTHSTHTKKHDKVGAVVPPDDYPPERRTPVGDRRRRHAAPNHLQKADEALTNLLNEKAQEFQKSVEALQQALQTVQMAEQQEQSMSPLNVMPPGSVNVMPGQDAGQPLPLGPGAGGLPPAGATPPGAAPGGDAQGAAAPPPLPPSPDAGGAAPPPDPSQQIQARRRRRQSSVFTDWDKWLNRRGQNGRLPTGSDADYDAFASEMGVGDKALQSLKARHFQHRSAPQQQMQAKRRRQAAGARQPNEMSTKEIIKELDAGNHHPHYWDELEDRSDFGDPHAQEYMMKTYRHGSRRRAGEDWPVDAEDLRGDKKRQHVSPQEFFDDIDAVQHHGAYESTPEGWEDFYHGQGRKAPHAGSPGGEGIPLRGPLSAEQEKWMNDRPRKRGHSKKG